jgi:hypothetical protein
VSQLAARIDLCATGDCVKHCSRCDTTKQEDEFGWKFRDRGVRDCWCRPCRSDYHRWHYRQNKARYKAQAARRRREVKLERTRWLLDYFADHPCTDCGEGDPIVLEFDHLRDKELAMARAIVDCSWETFLAEIEKCEIVCANCHRRRTAARGGFLRHRLTSGPPEQLTLPI